MLFEMIFIKLITLSLIFHKNYRSYFQKVLKENFNAAEKKPKLELKTLKIVKSIFRPTFYQKDKIHEDKSMNKSREQQNIKKYKQRGRKSKSKKDDAKFTFQRGQYNQKHMQMQVERTTFSRSKWELKPKVQPHPARRWCHTATIHGSHLYIMGGRLAESAKAKEYAYRIHCQTFQCEPIILSDNPLMRESHSCSLINDSMYVLFGMNKAAKVLNDCLELKITPNSLIWQKKNQTQEIDPRESHMNVILDDRYILIYGGLNGEQKLIEDFHIYDIVSGKWRRIFQISGQVEGKVGGSLINIKNQIYLFGGQINDQNQYSNQIYKIQINNYKETDEVNETQIQIVNLNVTGPKPLPRSQFGSAVYKDRYLIVVGGEGPAKEKNNPANLLNDIWAFDTSKLTWEEIITQNPQLFKPRSSFTATIYKESLICFGGLISIKDFKSSDEIYVLNLSSQVDRKPICNLCKSSFKSVPKQQIEVEKSKAIENKNSFQTTLSTVFAISRTIQSPFVAITTLLHSFDFFAVEKCCVQFEDKKIKISLKKTDIDDLEWFNILGSYEFTELIQESDNRVRKSIGLQIRRNMLNYLSYNIKNTCFRLGNELLISFINSRQEMQICLMNKFGIYHSIDVNRQNCLSSQTSIILKHMKEYDIDANNLLEYRMTIVVTSLRKKLSIKTKKHCRQVQFDPIINDAVYQDVKLKDYLRIAFAKPLSYQLAISHSKITFTQTQMLFSVEPHHIQKWPQTNCYPEFFQQICTYKSEGNSLILVYKQNKLMHSKKIDSLRETVIEFHLTKNIESNLTFSDVQPTVELINAIKSVVMRLKQQVTIHHKRGVSLQREERLINGSKVEYLNEIPKKVVKKDDYGEDDRMF